jgi:hypothetical protein
MVTPNLQLSLRSTPEHGTAYFEAHNELYGDKLSSFAAYGTAAFWCALAIGMFTSTLAIKRLVSIFPGHFEFLWEAQVWP